MKKAPTDMVMIARVSILLRGVANAFNVRLKVAKQWRGYAEDLLRETDPEYRYLHQTLDQAAIEGK